MLKSAKQTAIAELTEIYQQYSTVILAHYQGLTVNDIYRLRTSLKKKQIGLKVIKNTLARIASKNAGISDDARDMFKGPLCIIYAHEYLSPSKMLVEFTKHNASLKIVGGIIDKHNVDRSIIEEYAHLPSLEEIRLELVRLISTPALQLIHLIQARSQEEHQDPS